MSDIFDHEGDAWERAFAGEGDDGGSYSRTPPHCRRCKSTDVRWRQQGGKWVLFSLQPGVVHVCEPSADDFGAVE